MPIAGTRVEARTSAHVARMRDRMRTPPALNVARSRRRSQLARVAVTLVVATTVRCTPVDRMRAHFALKNGNLAYQRQDYERAIAHYDASIASAPRSSTAYLNRAYAEVALYRTVANEQARAAAAQDAVRSFHDYLNVVDARGGEVERHDLTGEAAERRLLTFCIESKQ